jgi:hypothetical protein
VLRFACCIVVVACGGSSGGGSSAPTTTTTTSPVTAASVERDAERDEVVAREELDKKEAIAATHRVAELEQQNAMAASCSEPKPWNKQPRCLPSCYPTQEADTRAETKLTAAMELQHVVCKRIGEVPYAVVDEIGGAKLRVQPARGKFPRPHKKGSWQAELATWFRDEQTTKLPKTDVIIVKGTWANRKHPVSRERMSCVAVSRFTRGLRGKLDECGASPKGITCEAAGNGAARAINVVHYRVVEAKRLKAAGKADGCQQAALEAIAVSRGLPRWRQYKKLNVAEWNDKLVYKTRFDGLLGEDALFDAVTLLGSEAEAIYAACGGTGATTTVEQEQSFHMCW